MISPGVAFALVLNAHVVAAGLVLLGYRQLVGTSDTDIDDSTQIAAWNDEAAALAREVQSAVDRSGGVLDHDSLQRRVLPLSSRIDGHVRAAPAGVDEALVADLSDLGAECYSVAMEHTTRDAMRTGEFLEDRLDGLQTQATALEQAVDARTGDGNQDSGRE